VADGGAHSKFAAKIDTAALRSGGKWAQ
jgi:hypothetical protein